MRGGELQLNKYGAGVYSYVWAGLVKDGVPCMIFTASTDHCLLYILIKVAINKMLNLIFFETVPSHTTVVTFTFTGSKID